MNDYVTKPVDARRLLETLDSHLSPMATESADSAPDGGTGHPTNLLDLGAIDTLFELDPSGAFLIEVADEFVRDAQIIVADVEMAVGGGDAERVADLLHGLKSAAGYAGAAHVRARASALHADLTRVDLAESLDEVLGFVRDANLYREAVAQHLAVGSITRDPDPPARTS